MAHTRGITYIGWQEKATGPIDDPNLSTTLQIAVPPECRFKQFCVQAENLGWETGNEFEFLMAANDPMGIITDRAPSDGMSPISEGQLSFSAYKMKTMEWGYAIRYNVGDVKMSRVKMVPYVKDFLARDVAKVIDRCIAMELDFTPYHYIPTSDFSGVNVNGLKDFCMLNGVEPFPLKLSNYIPMVGHTTWGSQPEWFLPGYYDWNLSTHNDFKEYIWNANPLFLTGQMQNTQGGNILGIGPRATIQGGVLTKSTVDFSAFDGDGNVLDPAAYPYPLLTITHLSNMVQYAISLGIFPFKQTESLILIAPPRQISNLIQSFWVQRKNTNTFMGPTLNPIDWKSLNDTPNIYGAQVRIPGIGVDVIAVADTYATLYQYDDYKTTNEALLGRGGTADVTDPCKWGVDIPTMMGSILDVSCLGSDLEHFEKNGMEMVLPWHRNLLAGDPLVLKRGYANTLWSLPQGLGPCYLMGRETVCELINENMHIETDVPEDFRRIDGYAWLMRSGYKSMTCPNDDTTIWGVPFESVQAIDPDTGIPSGYCNLNSDFAQFYARTRVIKFNWPTWIYMSEPRCDNYLSNMAGRNRILHNRKPNMLPAPSNMITNNTVANRGNKKVYNSNARSRGIK